MITVAIVLNFVLFDTFAHSSVPVCNCQLLMRIACQIICSDPLQLAPNISDGRIKQGIVKKKINKYCLLLGIKILNNFLLGNTFDWCLRFQNEFLWRSNVRGRNRKSLRGLSMGIFVNDNSLQSRPFCTKGLVCILVIKRSNKQIMK